MDAQIIEVNENRLLPNWMHQFGNSLVSAANATNEVALAVETGARTLRRTAELAEKAVVNTDEVLSIMADQHKQQLLAKYQSA